MVGMPAMAGNHEEVETVSVYWPRPGSNLSASRRRVEARPGETARHGLMPNDGGRANGNGDLDSIGHCRIGSAAAVKRTLIGLRSGSFTFALKRRTQGALREAVPVSVGARGQFTAIAREQRAVTGAESAKLCLTTARSSIWSPSRTKRGSAGIDQERLRYFYCCIGVAAELVGDRLADGDNAVSGQVIRGLKVECGFAIGIRLEAGIPVGEGAEFLAKTVGIAVLSSTAIANNEALLKSPPFRWDR